MGPKIGKLAIDATDASRLRSKNGGRNALWSRAFEFSVCIGQL